MNDPRVLTLFSGVFIILGVFNIVSGLRRLRAVRERGKPMPWYRQLNILTGTEYLLLSLVFLLSLCISFNVLPAAFSSLVAPAYLIVLVSSAIMAVFVVRQSVLNGRAARRNAAAATTATATTTATVVDAPPPMTSAEADAAKRRREHRQKAAAARRRRAGKA